MTAPGPIYQMAYVVPDIRAAVDHWARTTGAGPFFLFENFQFIDPVYLGRPGAPTASLALGYSGDLNIELIEQHDAAPSVYRELIDSDAYGFHHVARLTRDIDGSIAAAEAEGAPCVFRATFEPATRLAYCDTRARLGCYMEFVEYTEAAEAILAQLRQAARDWDGHDPLRRFGAD